MNPPSTASTGTRGTFYRAAILLIGILLCYWGFIDSGRCRVSLRNLTEEKIASVTVAVFEQGLESAAIGPRGEFSIPFKRTGLQPQYRVTVTFESGKRMAKAIRGWPRDFDFTEEIIIRGDDIGIGSSHLLW